MSLTGAFSHELARTVRIVNRSGGDLSAHGVPTVEEELSDPIVGYMEPARSGQQASEDLSDQAVQVDRQLLILPAGPVLSGNEAVEVDGVRYEIAGPPRRYSDGAAEHHVEVDIHRTTG